MTLLNRQQCSALRGIAITGIFMHNYLHWLGPMVKENEYQFIQHNVDRMAYELTHPTADIFYHLFSFFGHYGVPVFLFLSGYGLVKKYEQGGAEEKALPFIRKHFMKLFPMMILGFAVFTMVDWMTPGRHHWTWVDTIAQLTMTINLLPDPDHIIWPGPYWFFGLMMQLYIIYRLLLYKRHWGWTLALMVVCTAMQALCFNDPEGEMLNRLRYNCIGGMLPFGMGLLIGRSDLRIYEFTNSKDGLLHKENSNHNLLIRQLVILSICIICVLLLSLNFWGWLFVPVFIVLFNISIVKLSPRWLLRAFEWMGALSAAIFVAHPVARKIFIPISRRGDILDGLVLYIIATIVLAMIYRIIISKLKID